MGKKLVSLIIPAYNAKKWLLELFNSIEKSEYKNFEVILLTAHKSYKEILKQATIYKKQSKDKDFKKYNASDIIR